MCVAALQGMYYSAFAAAARRSRHTAAHTWAAAGRTTSLRAAGVLWAAWRRCCLLLGRAGCPQPLSPAAAKRVSRGGRGAGAAPCLVLTPLNVAWAAIEANDTLAFWLSSKSAKPYLALQKPWAHFRVTMHNRDGQLPIRLGRPILLAQRRHSMPPPGHAAASVRLSQSSSAQVYTIPSIQPSPAIPCRCSEVSVSARSGWAGRAAAIASRPAAVEWSDSARSTSYTCTQQAGRTGRL